MLFRRDRRSHQRAQKADRCWILKTTIFKKKKKHVLKLNLIKTNSIPQPNTDRDEYKSKATIRSRSFGCLCNSVNYFKSKADITRPLLTHRLLYSTTICSFPFGKHSNPKKMVISGFLRLPERIAVMNYVRSLETLSNGTLH